MSDGGILALGEAMVEFNQTGGSGSRVYLQGFGGDTSNFAIAAARQGARVGYLSAVGDDAHGRMLRRLWAEEGVDAGAVRTDAGAFTAVYFVTHDAEGHHFSFLRHGSAASRMSPAALPRGRIASAKVLHLSAISLSLSPGARATCEVAVGLARAAAVAVSFDTNFRAQLWSAATARPVIEAAIGACDICLPSLDDMVALSGLDDADAIVDRCLELGARTVALKCGARGAVVATAAERHRIPPMPCTPLDATGAGDAFGGAFVARLVAGDDLREAGHYAAAAAALSTEGYGAVAPIPRAAAVEALLAATAR